MEPRISGGPNGNPYGGGAVFQLVPGPDGSWTENVLYGFCAMSGCADGYQPITPLVFDASGNLYGTTTQGGEYADGVVFELVHGAEGTWTEEVLYSFCAVSGCADDIPFGNLIFDSAGNLYGTTLYGGNRNCEVGCGAVFELTPGKDGAWTEQVLHSFNYNDGAEPNGLVFDGRGDLYGTAAQGGIGGGAGNGLVFRLTPGKDGAWTETVIRYFYVRLHSPGGVVFDRAGNLYGNT